MGFWNKYPYTDFHELNLDYVLARMKELEDHIATLDDYIDAEIKRNLQDYINQLNQLVSEVHSLENRVDATLQSYDERLNQEIANINQQFVYLTNNLNQYLASEIARIDGEIAADRAEMRNEFLRIDRQLREALAMIDGRFEAFKREINYLLQDFLDKLPESFYVVSPFTGQLITVQDAVDELYENGTRFRAITAGEFDSLGLTAQEFDDLELTAWEFDMYGLDYLPVRDPKHHMYSPFTGLWSTLQTVINEIIDFSDRAHSITAGDFDAAELTAGEFDALDMYAYTFDFNAADIIGA